MSSYVSKAYQKFQQDAPSKLIYDVLKGTLVFILGSLATLLLPERLAFKKWLVSEYCNSIYQLIFLATATGIVAALLVLFLTRRKIRQLTHNADRDELTGLKNGTAFKRHLDKKITEAQKKQTTLSLIILDIDDFKRFNTQYDYSTASELIRKVGEILGTDKRATDELFRQFQKGDEFLVVAEKTNLNGARIAAERKRELIEQTHFEIESSMHKVTVSCGIAEMNLESDTTVTLIARTTKALKLAKDKGKNCTEAIA